MSKKVTTKTATHEKYAFWLENDALKRLRDYQKEVGVPVSESLRRAIDAYIKTLPKSR